MVQSNVGQRRDERSLLSTVFKSLCLSHLVASTPIGVIASFADFLNKGKCENTEDPAEEAVLEVVHTPCIQNSVTMPNVTIMKPRHIV